MAILLRIEQSVSPTEEELLAEARAWGFNTVEEWLDAIDKASEEYEADHYYSPLESKP